ncbi:MAG: TonB-dependent receptor [Tannerellaceae bacterium]|jgi:hypothetical protein|nr:TonB-dependent receptor [Tannerellaceae bacterium]
MKRLFLYFMLLCSVDSFAQEIMISGRVEDETAQPVPFVNIYVDTSGVMSGDDGSFSFLLNAGGKSFTLNASAIGYESYSHKFAATTDSLFAVIIMRSKTTGLQEVVVKGLGQRIKGGGAWTNLSPIAIATTGGSVGDLYRSMQIVPGVQIQGESGKLVVHGGDSRETQTYIDDMHVLIPYTTTGENSPARGRYSPFMFEGINFSSGGYSQEYGDGLSAVLPLFTKDESKLSKWGVNPSTTGVAGGGTKAFDKGSVSLNLDYGNLGPYFSVMPNRLEMTEPYQTASAATQLRFTPTAKTIFKSYISYDRTQFAERIRSLTENNIYVNTTFRHTSDNGYLLFAGAAYADMVQHVEGARHEGDTFKEQARELHMKAKISKRFSNFINLSAGAEGYLRRFGNEYSDSAVNRSLTARPDLFAAFVIATLYPMRNMNVDISARMESGVFSPRISANYNMYGINLSLTAGRYLQQPEANYLYVNPDLQPEQCLQYVAGVKYLRNGKIYRTEAYYKDYSNLPLQSAALVTSGGYGYSKGLDLYFSDEALFRNFEYRLFYSLNLSERKSGVNQEMRVPYYVSRHNASVALKYAINPLKSIVGLTCQYAGGRPYDGGLTKPYNSLDMSVTFLANSKLIVYGSISNILGVKNQFSNAAGALVRPAYDRFVYIGVFISLGGKSAYDVSNF